MAASDNLSPEQFYLVHPDHKSGKTTGRLMQDEDGSPSTFTDDEARDQIIHKHAGNAYSIATHTPQKQGRGYVAKRNDRGLN